MVIIHGMEGAIDVCLSYGNYECNQSPPVFGVPLPSFCNSRFIIFFIKTLVQFLESKEHSTVLSSWNFEEKKRERDYVKFDEILTKNDMYMW